MVRVKRLEVELVDQLALAALLGGASAVLALKHVVKDAECVQQIGDMIGVAHHEGGRLGRHHHVVGSEVEVVACEVRGDHGFEGGLVNRDLYLIHVVPGGAQGLEQARVQRLSATPFTGGHGWDDQRDSHRALSVACWPAASRIRPSAIASSSSTRRLNSSRTPVRRRSRLARRA